MLITASWFAGTKALLGLRGVSPIWDDRPAYYLWLEDGPGPYAIQFEEGYIDTEGDHCASALFSLKCYPYPGRSEFDSLSVEERTLLESTAFDETQTPRFDQRERLHPSLFTVGAMEITYPLDDDTGALYRLEAPYRQQTFRRSQLPLSIPDTAFTQHSAERNVPSWDVSRPVFDCIVALHAFRVRFGPSRVLTGRAAGFHTVLEQDGSATLETSEDDLLFSSSVLFSESLTGSGEPSALDASAEDLNAEIIFDHKSTPCGCSHTHPPDLESPYAPRIWWEVARTELRSDATSTCGCHDH